jgi:predicted TPR repeat methyltransferase
MNGSQNGCTSSCMFGIQSPLPVGAAWLGEGETVMRGHERYERLDAETYEKPTLMMWLCRNTSDTVLRPMLGKIRNCNVLDVGLGTGLYTKILLANGCSVIGVDQHPHLCKVPVKVHQGDATTLTAVVGQKEFDAVVSTWMTDYLGAESLETFFAQAYAVLGDGGQLLTTVVRRCAVSLLYVTAAKRVRGVNKFCYRPEAIEAMVKKAGFDSVRLVPLDAMLGMGWAYAVVARK